MGKSRTDIDDIQESVREGFDLRQRLLGGSPLEKVVTVYTDAATGAELGGAEDIEGQGGLVMGRRRWGLLGRLEEVRLRAEALAKQEVVDEEEIAALEAESADLTAKVKPLLKKLEKSALVFTIRAVPDLIIRDTRRKAREALGIKNKGIQGKEEEYSLEYTAILLSASVASYVDNATGKTHAGLTVQEARDLRDYLPAGQFPKLDKAMIDVSFEAQIGHHATDSPDF